MAKEIERKFLVTDDSYRRLASAKKEIIQAYLSTVPEATVRVRVTDGKGFITVKGKNRGAVRNEWEYPVPEADAIEMIRCCAQSKIIDKTRYIVPACDSGLNWEVDEFHGEHNGLVVAEIELPDADADFPRPGFIGSEVTGDPAYYNSSLAGL